MTQTQIRQQLRDDKHLKCLTTWKWTSGHESQVGLEIKTHRPTDSRLQQYLYLEVTWSACCLLQVGFLFGILFNPADRGNMVLWKIDWLLPEYSAIYPRRQTSDNHLCENLKSYRPFLII
jgi:hypothetical protein